MYHVQLTQSNTAHANTAILWCLFIILIMLEQAPVLGNVVAQSSPVCPGIVVTQALEALASSLFCKLTEHCFYKHELL